MSLNAVMVKELFPPGFCPVVCGPDEMHCGAPWDSTTGTHTGPDFCIPSKISGTDGQECQNSCPPVCPHGEPICPGEIWSDGCKGPDFCGPFVDFGGKLNN